MVLIDTHCHLYLADFMQDVGKVIEQAKKVGVKKFYFPAIDSTEHDAMLLLESKYPNECVAMMGLHPCSVKANYKEELLLVEQWVERRKFAAIGEIGLDFYWDTTYKKEQYDSFEFQMNIALNKNLPIVIHTRNAMEETINCVKPFSDKGLRGIFHCFGGSYEEAKKIIDLGFLLGIGGVITYKKAGLDKVLDKIDLQHIVIETDAPYLTPVPFRGKRNESSYLQYIIASLANIKGVSEEEVASITTTNAEKLFVL